jgi:hypothetical protein
MDPQNVVFTGLATHSLYSIEDKKVAEFAIAAAASARTTKDPRSRATAGLT